MVGLALRVLSLGDGFGVLRLKLAVLYMSGLFGMGVKWRGMVVLLLSSGDVTDL